MPIWTPSEIGEYQKRVDREIDGLDAIANPCYRQATERPFDISEWSRFRTDWKSWLREHPAMTESGIPLLAGLTGQTADVIDEYARQVAAWRELIRRGCGQEPSTPSTTVPSDEELESVQRGIENAGKGIGTTAILVGFGFATAIGLAIAIRR